MLIGIRVLADAGHLPGDLHSWRTASDLEVVTGNLFSDVEARPRSADGCEEIEEVPIKGAEPLRQLNGGVAPLVEGHDAVVDVLHIGRLYLAE